jgi:ATP/ADP translocase
MTQMLLAKASEYVLFHPTTKVAYILLDDKSKVKDKAPIEVIGL